MARIATTKNQWKDYYKCLLNKGLATIETIRQEYYDYEDRGIEWMKSPDKISYLNAQAAMKEILEEASIAIQKSTPPS